MLRRFAHWHGQSSNLRTSEQRQLLGVQGIQRQVVTAEIQWMGNDTLNLLVFNARVRPPATRASVVLGLEALQCSELVHDGEEPILILCNVQVLQSEYFSNLLLQEPSLVHGPRTGARVRLALPNVNMEPRAFTVGEMFALVAREPNNKRYVIHPEDGRTCNIAHVAENVIMDAILEPALVPPEPPPVVPVEAQPNAIPVAPPVQDQQAHAVIPVGRRVAGAPDFQGAVAAAQAMDRVRQPVVQFQRGGLDHNVPAPFIPPREGQRQPIIEVGSPSPRRENRPAPWAYLGPSTLQRLCGRLSQADTACIERWDDLVSVLSNGNVPLHATTPRDMLSPRMDFIHIFFKDADVPTPKAPRRNFPK